MSTIHLPKNSPLVVSVLTELAAKSGITVKPGNSLTYVSDQGVSVKGLNQVVKTLTNFVKPSDILFGNSNCVREAALKWVDLTYLENPSKQVKLEDLLNDIEEQLKTRDFILTDTFTLADLCAISYLEKSRQFPNSKKSDSLVKWFKRCASSNLVASANISLSGLKIDDSNGVCTFEDGGRFFDLPQAVMGQVVVRFPPEASGYLHIGHAKAALLNQFYATKYNGKLIMRFDDTNPLKEKGFFEEIILEDIKLLGLQPSMYSRTSDYFDTILSYAEALIRSGHAYCDNTPTEVMREERNRRVKSKCRSQSVEENIRIWELMKKGQATEYCLRGKIDMDSDNGCMRDPTFHRYCAEPHPAQGTKYCIYPTYDFACPIVDSIEGVTHALRTLEYKDRDDQYMWVLDKLNLRKPIIHEYSRLSMQYTVLSKRKLTKLVDTKVVEGWDDPRMPTVRGLLRRGLTVQGLKEFILAQGFSKCNVNMQNDKLWAFNKKAAEPNAPRFSLINTDGMVEVRILSKIEQKSTKVPLVPKDPNSPTRTINYTNRILIEGEDAKNLKTGDVFTLMNWGNVKIVKMDSSLIQVDLNLENKDFANTLKVTWVNMSDEADVQAVDIQLRYYKNLLNKAVIEADDELEQLINRDSMTITRALGEAYLKNVKKGDVIQIIRKGLFICDCVQTKGQILTLVEIPSGSATETKPEPSSKIKKIVEKKSEVSSKQNGNKTNKSEPLAGGHAEAKSTEKLSGTKKVTKLGINVKKDEDFSNWYTQVLIKSEMLDYYDVSGCYVLRPLAYSVWESIQRFFDDEIKKIGVQNCYFPLFVSKSALTKEKDHINDFAPEVAWVTRAGETELQEPIAIRPTSETVMYPLFAKWIQSYRDLPLKINQWCNVVRWEFKHPTPFLRSREFLWQEGHTVFADKQEAIAEVYQILDLYARVYTDLLAIPVIKGHKSTAEKFAGAEFTTTVETYIPSSGRGIQGATSHHLAQNFSKMFEIEFEDPSNGEKVHAYQNSWGLSTRTIGALVMVHSDDKGLVLPPKVSPTQVVIIPCGITAKSTDDERKKLLQFCESLSKSLTNLGVRVSLDSRDFVTVGWKFNYWELKGVPLRIEVGPKELSEGSVILVRRDTGEKTVAPASTLDQGIVRALDLIQSSLFAKAKNDMDSNTVITEDFDAFTTYLAEKKIIMSPFCGEKSCEEQIRKGTTTQTEESDGKGGTRVVVSMGAKTLCIPIEQPKQIETTTKCIRKECQNKASCYAMFGRSY